MRVVGAESSGQHRRRLEAAIGPKTAMIYVLAAHNRDQSVLNTKAIAQVRIRKAFRSSSMRPPRFSHSQRPSPDRRNARRYAAESVARPSDGGLLLGRKISFARMVHSAPHHGPGRASEGRKEDDRDASAVEMGRSVTTTRMAAVGGVARPTSRAVTAIMGDGDRTQPNGLSNRTPSLRLW